MTLADIPTFASPDIFHVVVESPRGSMVKLKYEPKWDAMSVSRPLPLGVIYPFDWGFVPSTRVGDGDALDAMLFWDVPSYPGVVMPCRAIGVLQVEQNKNSNDSSERVRNDRVLAVPCEARREKEIRDVTAIGPRMREELEQFAIAATALEGKDLRIIGWGDAKAALKLVQDSVIR